MALLHLLLPVLYSTEWTSALRVPLLSSYKISTFLAGIYYGLFSIVFLRLKLHHHPIIDASVTLSVLMPASNALPIRQPCLTPYIKEHLVVVLFNIKDGFKNLLLDYPHSCIRILFMPLSVEQK
jgi:hypothetical protein